jgi:hypothetical protein
MEMVAIEANHVNYKQVATRFQLLSAPVIAKLSDNLSSYLTFFELLLSYSG